MRTIRCSHAAAACFAGRVPELPEVELARVTLERAALRRRIAGVDDTDRRECRPHPPGEVRDALVGRTLTGAFRRGKTLWCATSGVGRSRRPGRPLGLHLGMTGQIVVTSRSGKPTGGGGQSTGRYRNTAEYLDGKPQWNRFTVTFADGGTLRLFDMNRLGRVWLDPDLDELGPDAEEIEEAELRERLCRGTGPIKARLLDQTVVAGVGNLLADETLWQARVNPRRRTTELSSDELVAVHHALHETVKAAIRRGGAHTGEMIEFRAKGACCPRCGAPMQHGTVGGRTTWWCPREQT